jgi:uncharacterized protein YcnI
MNKIRVIAVGVLGALGALIAFAVPASAHVTVYGPDATQGGEAVLTFRVPTESAAASTTKLQVQLPTAAPIASVLVQPTPGWTAKTITTKLANPILTSDGDRVSEAVSEVDWTADSAAAAIKPGEFGQFVVSVGPLPKVATMRFGAIQTYSDGTVTKWIETPAPGSSVEPEHPAPELTLAPAAAGTTATMVAGVHSSTSSNTGPIVLSVVALVVAAGALGLAFVSRARGGRS